MDLSSMAIYAGTPGCVFGDEGLGCDEFSCPVVKMEFRGFVDYWVEGFEDSWPFGEEAGGVLAERDYVS